MKHGRWIDEGIVSIDEKEKKERAQSINEQNDGKRRRKSKQEDSKAHERGASYIDIDVHPSLPLIDTIDAASPSFSFSFHVHPQLTHHLPPFPFYFPFFTNTRSSPSISCISPSNVSLSAASSASITGAR